MDDARLYRMIQNVTDVLVLQNDLNRVSQWLQDNGLRIKYYKHIRQVEGWCNKILGFIKRITFKLRPVHIVIHLYNTLILPILLFASPIGHAKHKINLDH